MSKTTTIPSFSVEANGVIVANAYVDIFMQYLSSNAMVCLLYAIRHIRGWKNNEGPKPMSITMFTDGYITRNNIEFGGTGLRRNAVVKSLKELTDYGILVKVGDPTQRGQLYRLGTDSEINIGKLIADQKASKARIKKRFEGSGTLNDTGIILDTASGTLNDTALGIILDTEVNEESNGENNFSASGNTSIIEHYTAQGGMTDFNGATELQSLAADYGIESVVSAIDAMAGDVALSIPALATRLRKQHAKPDRYVIPKHLEPMVTALKSKRPASATHQNDRTYGDAAQDILDLGLSVEDVDALWLHVKRMAYDGKWPSYSVKALANNAPDYIEKRNARARAQEQRAAAPEDPIDYDAMLSASLDRASLYEATGD